MLMGRLIRVKKLTLSDKSVTWSVNQRIFADRSESFDRDRDGRLSGKGLIVCSFVQQALDGADGEVVTTQHWVSPIKSFDKVSLLHIFIIL